MADFIDTPTGRMLGNPDDLSGSGSAGGSDPFVPGAPSPASGSPPFKGLEPIEEASPKGINVAGPPVNKPGA